MLERNPNINDEMEMPPRMALESMDIAEEKRQQLKQLFPEVFNEDKVDFEQLQRVLGESIDTGRERYGLTWPGKADCMKVIQEPSRATLKPCREESVNFDNTENLFIEGDNLEVLKLLQKSYFGKVKMIYIDPPYNTGKEFIYPDNYQETIETYMAYAGLVDDEGRKFSTNATTEGRFHSKWLNMMYPRLYLAKNLLREDGVIFISIDDNEVENLRRICNEIFGEENFISQLVWEKKKKGAFLSGAATNIKEYVLVCSKNKREFNGLIGEIARNKETYPVIKTTNTRGVRTIKKGIPSKFREKNHTVKSGSRISSGNMEMILLSDMIIRNGILQEDVKVESNWIYSQELLDKYSNDKSLYVTQDLYFRRVVSEPRLKMLKDCNCSYSIGKNRFLIA
ncbi:site-specific DNA-methyltransferase [Endozoicomonas gorgoniicola]|uniref:site-specific DNA-methyltransferase (adenine-specific) n=1 Tax=Endozoicomonas gorgoniicola TaxID=1234144 RepID=A0ABT3N328_9GAMM|nr:site-specific DNA-methyltransferase [Endozoicomonas gorgoniicola]MCW7556026.1 site-specific DNA-methyltransferase [Endozoicomonas gorgoniicola]